MAAASQKFTCPGETGVPPAMTVAVSIIGVPGATEVTALPPDVTARVVVVVAPGFTVTVTGGDETDALSLDEPAKLAVMV